MVLSVMALVMMVMLVLHNNAGTAFNTTVHFTDGSTTVFKRRERPHVVFSDPTRPSTPTHLTSVSSPRAIRIVRQGGRHTERHTERHAGTERGTRHRGTQRQECGLLTCMQTHDMQSPFHRELSTATVISRTPCYNQYTTDETPLRV